MESSFDEDSDDTIGSGGSDGGGGGGLEVRIRLLARS